MSYIRESSPFIVSLPYYFSHLSVSLTYITQVGLQSPSYNPNNALHFLTPACLNSKHGTTILPQSSKLTVHLVPPDFRTPILYAWYTILCAFYFACPFWAISLPVKMLATTLTHRHNRTMIRSLPVDRKLRQYAATQPEECALWSRNIDRHLAVSSWAL